jgi:hypothetical protein
MRVTAPAAEPTSPPWFARLAPRRQSRLAPDVLDYLVAAGCFAAFTLPVLLGAASRIGSPLVVTVFGAGAAAPLILRRKWPIAAVAAVAADHLCWRRSRRAGRPGPCSCSASICIRARIRTLSRSPRPSRRTRRGVLQPEHDRRAIGCRAAPARRAALRSAGRALGHRGRQSLRPRRAAAWRWSCPLTESPRRR